MSFASSSHAYPNPSFDISDRKVAYFSMEIALSKSLPTYSGGLGMLAGDTLRSAADTGVSMVAISLVHRRGYFEQHLDAAGQQTESDVVWSPESTLPSANQTITLRMQNRDITLCAWRFDVVGVTGHVIPVFLLDADVDGNDPWDQHLTDHLYGGDTYYRLCQETILGLGGIHLLHALGCQPEVCHMNEGHAALLTIGLLEARLAPSPIYAATDADADAIKQRCVFTTHTPVPAGHDKFGIDQMIQILGHERSSAIERFNCIHNGLLNMTYLALRFSRYVNGVAMLHGKVSQQMFPEYQVHAITNGVHAATWLAQPFQQLFDKEIPSWRHDNQYFRSVYGIEASIIDATHAVSKQRLFDTVRQRTGLQFDPDILTLGFARRVATYKRANLVLYSPERLIAIAERLGGLQILMAGKSHPADNAGKSIIRGIFTAAAKLEHSKLRVLYLENYDWELGEQLTNGVDVWLNTPLRPYEASGTSGMKAALNGVPSLSIMDGWWVEGCAENITGWCIENTEDEVAQAEYLYDKLENAVAPLYRDKVLWAEMRRHCIAMNGTFFNTHRMLGQYVSNAYFPASASVAASDQIVTSEVAQAVLV
ncbi:MAG: alpha-glucan family phosphorylase [Acidobacteria bacterium]|nr:alpha-glucan family phosphorylase [Acidobacteriota bacterium]